MRARVRWSSLLSVLLVSVVCAVANPPTVRAALAPRPATAVASGVAPGAFTIAVIPDTQNGVFGGDQRFANRTQWLADNRSVLNLVFVLHTGDMMNWDTPDHAQYAVARSAMSRLDAAGIPWIPAIGNHDTAAVCPGGSACPQQSTYDNLRRTDTFNQYFPLARFSWVGGVFQAGRIDNTWSTFTAGEEDWLVLNLELWPRPAVISWARGVVASHPNHNVVIATHSYLTGGGGIEQGNGGYGDTSPQYMFDNLVAPYSNVKLVFSGHVGIAGHRTDVRPDGSKVVSVLGTFHSNRTNPTQLMTVDTAAGTVSTRFYAPWDGATWPQYARSVSGLRWASGVDPSAPTVGLRAMANNRIVTAEGGGGQPLIANRTSVGWWERFAWQRLAGGRVAVRALVNQRFVVAEGGGAQPLIANRRYLGQWETFDLLTNADGTISLRSLANGRYVSAEAGGAQPLVANRTSIGQWEKFRLVPQ
jgi:hypothetical protein